MITNQYEIGFKFVRKNTRRQDVETVVDILTTTNDAGEVVKVEYITEHDFMGQTVTASALNSTITLGQHIM